MQMLLDLMEERQRWLNQRDEAIREISRLSELIRATINMIPADQIARYEPIFERLENRPAGLSMAIRACFTSGATPASLWAERYKGGPIKAEESKREEGQPERGKAEGRGTDATAAVPEKEAAEKNWLTPVEIRDALKRMGFPFENYKANPLASIHTTLKRMVPAEMETKTLKDGQKVYRLEERGRVDAGVCRGPAMADGQFQRDGIGRQCCDGEAEQRRERPGGRADPPAEGAKRGTSGGA